MGLAERGDEELRTEVRWQGDTSTSWCPNQKYFQTRPQVDETNCNQGVPYLLTPCNLLRKHVCEVGDAQEFQNPRRHIL